MLKIKHEHTHTHIEFPHILLKRLHPLQRTLIVLDICQHMTLKISRKSIICTNGKTGGVQVDEILDDLRSEQASAAPSPPTAAAAASAGWEVLLLSCWKKNAPVQAAFLPDPA